MVKAAINDSANQSRDNYIHSGGGQGLVSEGYNDQPANSEVPTQQREQHT